VKTSNKNIKSMMERKSRTRRPRFAIHLEARSSLYSLAKLEGMFRLRGDFCSFSKGTVYLGKRTYRYSRLSLGRRLNEARSIEDQCRSLLERLKRVSIAPAYYRRRNVRWHLMIGVFYARDRSLELGLSRQFSALLGLVRCDVSLSLYGLLDSDDSWITATQQRAAERYLRQKYGNSKDL
jgi:hypothetical protein